MVVEILKINKPLPKCLALKTSVLHRWQIASDTDRDSVTLGVLYCFDLGEAEEPKVEVEEEEEISMSFK